MEQRVRKRGACLAGALIGIGLYASAAAQDATPTANLTPAAWSNGSGAQIVVNQRAQGQSGCVYAAHGTKTVKVVIDGTAEVQVVCEPHIGDANPQPINPTPVSTSQIIVTDTYCEQLCLNVVSCSDCAVSGYVAYDRPGVR